MSGTPGSVASSNERPGLGDFVRAWQRAINDTCYVAMTRAEKIAFLRGLARRLAATMTGETFDATDVHQIGADLAAAGFTAPEALGRTLALIHTRLLRDLGPSGPAAERRLVEVIEALGGGYARALRDRTLDAQEEMRWAALVARMRAQQDLRASEARVLHAALHDRLTGLPNRTLFAERLAATLSAAPPEGRLGVCFVGLDGFQTVNDSLGHQVGDRLLRAVAKRLFHLTDEDGHFVARLGGDEFAILVAGTSCTDDAVKVADKALAALTQPVELDNRELAISASVGVVERPAAETDPIDVMRAADITLHWAKADGRGRCAIFDPGRNAQDVARYRLSAAMPRALARNEFTLAYQPLVDLAGGTVSGVEALARWHHPRLGTLGAGEFVGLAEKTGLIVQLGIRLLERACQQAVDWLELTPDAPLMSVNLSVHQIRHEGLVADVAALLDRVGLPPDRLQLEITESAVMGPDDETFEVIQGLANLGVNIAIDDFGTGYSNLSYLCDLPVHGLKLASRFLRGRDEPADRKARGHRLLEKTVSLAHALDLTVTAEGIETPEQAQRLCEIGCDVGQGWYFGRPVPPGEISKLLVA